MNILNKCIKVLDAKTEQINEDTISIVFIGIHAIPPMPSVETVRDKIETCGYLRMWKSRGIKNFEIYVEWV